MAFGHKRERERERKREKEKERERENIRVVITWMGEFCCYIQNLR